MNNKLQQDFTFQSKPWPMETMHYVQFMSSLNLLLFTTDDSVQIPNNSSMRNLSKAWRNKTD